ncbi:hypothetical protein CAK95_09020 [Pseudorhodoplanes sinuspersici]|uniref:Large exoprotein involved in heme utilization or adhesion n=1 Tax=Pseudorhodoplanes sinuspersici TaxID=1235591 RepID=A0A1W6ZZR7_9HYPH|nr:hypothetical protein CAK95_09020 [Pseudorhodoplanes sinuspersici]
MAGGLLASGWAAPAFSAAKYDGNWSVVVITERGDCDRAYRYPVRVVNGAIQYTNEAGISITGRVDSGGRLRASIRRGQQRADGSGRLSATGGAGVWSGKDNVKQCSGRWEAERRGG